jgi:hypothetical protein
MKSNKVSEMTNAEIIAAYERGEYIDWETTERERRNLWAYDWKGDLETSEEFNKVDAVPCVLVRISNIRRNEELADYFLPRQAQYERYPKRGVSDCLID